MELKGVDLMTRAHSDVQAFDTNGEGHRKVDVAFGDFLVKAFGDEGAADQQ